jgi:hypothetical protein
MGSHLFTSRSGLNLGIRMRKKQRHIFTSTVPLFVASCHTFLTRDFLGVRHIRGRLFWLHLTPMVSVNTPSRDTTPLTKQNFALSCLLTNN